MNLYENIKQTIQEDIQTPVKGESLAETYENFYQVITRLEDLDDLKRAQFNNIKEFMEAGVSFSNALNNALSIMYDFSASYKESYFKDTIEYFKEDLEEIYKKAVSSNAPEESWNADITFLIKNSTAIYNGKEYTLEQLRKLIEENY